MQQNLHIYWSKTQNSKTGINILILVSRAPYTAAGGDQAAVAVGAVNPKLYILAE
jgi:hypothetical protein